VEWSWTLFVDRVGNPAVVLMLDNLSPSIAGDMQQQFISYWHFLDDLRINLFSSNFHLLGVKLLICCCGAVGFLQDIRLSQGTS